MGRRCLGLLMALALLVVPGAASAAPQHARSDGHSAPRITAADRHANVAHVAGRSSTGRERRRTPHHSSSSLAVLGGASGITPGVGRADLHSTTTSAPGDLPSSSRPRAPPAV